MSRRHGESNLAQRFAGAGVRPQIVAAGQASVVLGAHQPIGRRSQFLCTRHQRQHIRFSVGHVYHADAGQLRCQFGQPLIAFGPVQAFFQSATLAKCILFSRAHIQTSKIPSGSRRWRRGIGRMQIHAALGLVAQRAETTGALAVEVERCVSCKHNTTGCALIRDSGLLPMRLQISSQSTLALSKKTVRRHRLIIGIAGLGHTRRRLGRQSLHQYPRSLVQARPDRVV